MITTVRSSKRLAFGAVLGLCLVLVCLLAVKDLNDKLGVMTASNTGYQKMTDSQMEKIRSLTSELEGVRGSKVAELRSAEKKQTQLEAKISKLQRELQNAKSDLSTFQNRADELHEQKVHLQSENDELKRMASRQKKDAETLSVQLRDQIARLSLERDQCQHQYQALFKLQQETSDTMQTLKHENKRLQVEQTMSSSSTSAKAAAANLQLPNSKQVIQQPQDPRILRSSSSQPVGLEQPHLIQNRPSVSSTLRTGSNPVGIANPPVGAEPPLHNDQVPNNYVVPAHQVGREDVMEAPKVVNRNRKFEENLDAQVDPVQQDHPGLQAHPVYREHNIGFDEDEMEDAVDGQILHHDFQAITNKSLKAFSHKIPNFISLYTGSRRWQP